ncbi:MAG: cobaltochelatase subunit CobN [bacterium]|nr:cobaltochelatase subunit CobN [bacterium]
MILFLSNADTELLAVRSIIDELPEGFGEVRWAHPERLEGFPDIRGTGAVVVRLLGGARAWEKQLRQLVDICRDRAVAVVALGGEAEPDAELAEMSTAPTGVVAEAHRYLAAGGPSNIAQMLRFVSDTLLLTGHGFAPPVELPRHGVWEGAGVGSDPSRRDRRRPLLGVLFYRAHLVAGNTDYVSSLCDAIERAGGDALAVYTYSLRSADNGEVPALEMCARAGVEALATSMFAAGGATGDHGDQWEAPQLADLGVPVIQAPASSRSQSDWMVGDAGLSPLDVAMGVAIPEFDGRIIGPTFAFKEVVDDGPYGELVSTRSNAERAERLASLLLNHAALRRTAPAAKRVALVLSAYPTKRGRLGNAVGLDTPASAIAVLGALARAGYGVDGIPAGGDELMAELAGRLTYDAPTVTASEASLAVGGMGAEDYGRWFGSLPVEARRQVEAVWGPAPGEVYLHDGRMVFPGLDLGNILVTVQPPRGFGPDPIVTYHAPDLPPPHHYLAFYRWLASPRCDGGWGADAIVHLGKHGTLEWLPGKATALSPACFPDAALAGVPLLYPFVVNDPGEGTQAKRRSHAVVIDHLPPPMTRADTYDDLARLEQLLDTHAQVEAMDPAKLPAIREQVWRLLVDMEIHRDLDLGDTAPDPSVFSDMVIHVDGYLCALKDAQIRGGLHVLGRPPEAEALVDSVLAVTRLPQGPVPSLRVSVASELGIELDGAGRRAVDRVEAECRRRVEALADSGWDPDSTEDPTLSWVANRLVPAYQATTDELTNLLAGLNGRYVPAGPSGAPTRGAAHVLPTGRNFYSVDPKALPSPLAWEVGSALADRLVERHVAETGAPPTTVGLVLWGTAAMRTMGDDVAQALALLGVHPIWNEESRRVAGLEVVSLADLGRPRIDVTLRISGFFRDAFPHVIDLLDSAVEMVAGLDETAEDNPVAEAGAADARIYGPPPGGYGSGILPVIESGHWRSDADLAEVYMTWSGFSYRRGAHGEEAPGALRRRLAAVEVAVKNQDNREHDIFDSDDYLQEHGGMVAAIRALTGREPRAWFGDSANPADPQVRSLAEEAARVVRSRVLNPKWIGAMREHGYKGAFELAATVDYLFGYDATARVVEDWMYERVTEAYVADPELREFFESSNPWALRSIAERLLEADERGMWDASDGARLQLIAAVLEAEGWEETR